MPSDHRTPEEIERDIERERNELKDTVEDLQDRLSIDHFVRQIGDQFRENGGEFSRSVGRAARDNPVALALTGIGLAWMMFGSPRRETHYAPARHEPEFGHETRPRLRHASSYASNTGYGSAAGSSHDRYRGGSATHMDLPDWAHDPAETDHDRSSGTSIGSAAARAGGKVKQGAHDAGSAVTSAAGKAGDGVKRVATSVSDTASSTWESTRDGVSNTAEAARERAAALRERLSRGTEHLGEEARQRVIAARERAIEARDYARRNMHRGAERASDFYDEHPLVVGALALAAGAALAGALPRSRFEDENLGRYSDELFHEAERIYEEERAKAEKVVSAGVDEAKRIADDLKRDVDNAAPEGKTATDALKDRAKDAASRVADKARETADKEKLGKPKVKS